MLSPQKILGAWVSEAEQLLASAPAANEGCGPVWRDVVSMAKEYFLASMSLLDKGFLFPACALLRIAAELTLKFRWCIEAPGVGGDTKEVRLMRWKEKSVHEWINILRTCEESDSPGEGASEWCLRRSALEKLHEQITQGEMPHVRELCDQLAEGTGTEPWGGARVYLGLFRAYNPAVHVDVVLLELKPAEGRPGTPSSAEQRARWAYRDLLLCAHMLRAGVYLYCGRRLDGVRSEFNTTMDGLGFHRFA